MIKYKAFNRCIAYIHMYNSVHHTDGEGHARRVDPMGPMASIPGDGLSTEAKYPLHPPEPVILPSLKVRMISVLSGNEASPPSATSDQRVPSRSSRVTGSSLRQLDVRINSGISKE